MRKPSVKAFTLVELLVVIGIIALLVSILLPALMTARRQANTVQCAANLRQVCTALLTYASEYKGAFPPYITNPFTNTWYDYDRAGKYLRGTDASTKVPDVRGRAVACPDDTDAIRSYSMNVWACSKLDGQYVKLLAGLGAPWKQNASNSSSLILAAEAWSPYTTGSTTTGFVSGPPVGIRGDTPGHRFVGFSPLWSAGRFGYVNCELPFYRHRTRGSNYAIAEPKGRVNIGYADGHVALKSESDLADANTGLSTLDSRWSPMDDDLNRAAAAAAAAIK